MMKHFEASLKTGECNNDLLNDFRLISENFMVLYNLRDDHLKNAVINYAVCEAWRKWKTYNPDRSNNIFSFFTTMISNDLKIHYNYMNHHRKTSISLNLFDETNETKK